MSRDPTQPIRGAPDPWASSTMPTHRAEPPYHMTEMIEAEAALAERLVRRVADGEAVRTLAQWLRDAATSGAPIEAFGCGTSDHAGEALSALLTDALALPAGGEVRHRQSLDAVVHPLASGVAIAISHEGGTAVSNLALEAARRAGARTALITVSDRSPGAALADVVLTTDEQDESWCHTVGYLSPILAAAALAAVVQGRDPAPHAIAGLLESSPHVEAADAVAQSLAESRSILIAGSGIDHAAARELALKLAEGARLPSIALDIESVLHGHLAAASDATGLIVILTDPAAASTQVLTRATKVLHAAAALGMPAAAILASEVDWDVDDSLTPAGRLLLRPAAHVPAVARSTIGAAVPLQLIAERMARARGMNPDTLGRDDPRQAAAHA